jgi:hypothetical protein
MITDNEIKEQLIKVWNIRIENIKCHACIYCVIYKESCGTCPITFVVDNMKNSILNEEVYICTELHELLLELKKTDENMFRIYQNILTDIYIELIPELVKAYKKYYKEFGNGDISDKFLNNWYEYDEVED